MIICASSMIVTSILPPRFRAKACSISLRSHLNAELSNSISGTERSLVGFAENFYCVGVGVKRPRDCRDQVFFLGEFA